MFIFRGLLASLLVILIGVVYVVAGFATNNDEAVLAEEVLFEQRIKENNVTKEESLRLINKERMEQGLAPLVWCRDLAMVAGVHAEDMYERNYVSHHSPEGTSPADRLREKEVPFSIMGENLVRHFPTVEEAVQGMMDSPGHKENILRERFGRVGIGVSQHDPSIIVFKFADYDNESYRETPNIVLDGRPDLVLRKGVVVVATSSETELLCNGEPPFPEEESEFVESGDPTFGDDNNKLVEVNLELFMNGEWVPIQERFPEINRVLYCPISKTAYSQ